MQLNEKIRKKLRKNLFHIVLLTSFSVPILTLMILDYLNIESFTAFNLGFNFLATWKGRMFYLFFLWLMIIESIINWDMIIQKQPKNPFRILVLFICISIPTIYVFSVNFAGIDKMVISLGQKLGFAGQSLTFHWPLCVEYLVFAFSFLATILFSYKKRGLEWFSISLGLLVGMSIIYTLDTFYPQGFFKPFEMLALPTAACAAAILDVLGYNFTLYFRPGLNAMPILMLRGSRPVAIAWPCAGVHSLFLYTLIILLLFKRSNIPISRKWIYFFVGAMGTYLVNVLRVVSYFVILRNNGEVDARYFHDNVGELYFISWIFTYILLIIFIEQYGLVERTRSRLAKFRNRITKGKFSLSE